MSRQPFFVFQLLFCVVALTALAAFARPSDAAYTVPKPSLTWIPANETNYLVEDRVHNKEIRYIIVHDTQETMARTIELFQQYNNVAAHYVIQNHLAPWGASDSRWTDGQLLQMVEDKNRGYHCGKGCNTYSIGIEHVGLISVDTLKVSGGYSLPMYRKSAHLSAWLCQTYAILPTRDYVLAHSENAKIGGNSDHVDPGIDWDWNLYMTLIRQKMQGADTCQYPSLRVGDVGRSVEAIQYMLQAVLPSQPIAVNGNFTNELLSTVQSFQNSAKLVRLEPAATDAEYTDGQTPVGLQTWRELLFSTKNSEIRWVGNNPIYIFKLGYKIPLVSVVQNLLAVRFYALPASHYSFGTVDAQFGTVDAATISAIKAFQANNSLVEPEVSSGVGSSDSYVVVGEQTLVALLSGCRIKLVEGGLSLVTIMLIVFCSITVGIAAVVVVFFVSLSIFDRIRKNRPAAPDDFERMK